MQKLLAEIDVHKIYTWSLSYQKLQILCYKFYNLVHCLTYFLLILYEGQVFNSHFD
jgi:hypothetical protein